MDSRANSQEDSPTLWEVLGLRRSDGHIGGSQVVIMLAIASEGGDASVSLPVSLSVEQARRIATHLNEMADHAEETA